MALFDLFEGVGVVVADWDVSMYEKVWLEWLTM